MEIPKIEERPPIGINTQGELISRASQYEEMTQNELISTMEELDRVIKFAESELTIAMNIWQSR